MKEKIEFLLRVNRLKEMPKTSWRLKNVKNPETVAEHTLRIAILAWLFAKRANLNSEKLIKIAFCHNLCAVYTGDKDPFFYYQRIYGKEGKKILTEYPFIPFSLKEKNKIEKLKFKEEKNSLLKLLKGLKNDSKKKILSLWLDYAKGSSKEGEFIRELNKIETLIQSIEYFGSDFSQSGHGWWKQTEEVVKHPLLLKFLKIIKKRFYGWAESDYEEDKELEGILDFALNIGKLKRMPRLYWILREVKNPETVAGHIFILAIMAWIFGREKKEFNLEKLIKMAFCHELSAVYTGDTTQYDRILPKEKEGRKNVLKKILRLSREEKKRIFLEDYKQEKKSFEKLVSKLTPFFQKETIGLWDEYRKKKSKEGCYLCQLNVLAVLFQGLLYEKEDKNFSAHPLWEWAFEACDDCSNLKLLEEMKKKFY